MTRPSAEEMQVRAVAHRKYWRDVAAENGIGYETYRARLRKPGWGPARAAMYPAQRRSKR